MFRPFVAWLRGRVGTVLQVLGYVAVIAAVPIVVIVAALPVAMLLVEWESDLRQVEAREAAKEQQRRHA